MTLSVAIITLNEEENLRRTLPSLQFADEVIVVDSGSTDKTVELARSFGAKVYEEPWKGYAGQKNSAIAKCTGDWILSLDADELVSPELAEQLRILLPSNPPHDAYYLPRRNIIFGRWIRHGGSPPTRRRRMPISARPAIPRCCRALSGFPRRFGRMRRHEPIDDRVATGSVAFARNGGANSRYRTSP